MSELRTLKIRIPGQWEDAWMYRGALLLWTTSGELVWIDIEELRGFARAQFGAHLAFLAQHLVLRSERKAEDEFVELSALSEVSAALFRPLQSSDETVLSIENAPIRSTSIEKIPGRVLDTQVYANRVFSAGDEGVYEAQFTPRFASSRSPLVQMTPRPATSIVSGAGRIAASLGTAGLVSRSVEFGDGEDWWLKAREQNEALETLSDYSRRVSRSSVHLLNYGDGVAPTFFYADTVYETSGQFQEAVTTDYHRGERLEGMLLDLLLSSDHASSAATVEDLRVFGNANYRLLARVAGRTAIVDLLPDHKTKDVSVRRDRLYAASEGVALEAGVPLAVHALNSAIALETLDGLSILGAHGIYQIETEQCVQVRTFPHSKRYRDTLVAVCDQHIDLVGFAQLGSP